jgi:uncharacterized protein (DUF2147 family)
MKSILTFILLAFTSAAPQVEADDILGVWLTKEGKGHVKISRYGDYFSGRIIWLKEPNDPDTGKPKLDKNNPNEKMRNTPILNYLVLQNFKFDDGVWTGGTIYDPTSGDTYKCKMKMQDRNTLEVRGFVGISLIGRTDYWYRVK